MTPQAANLAVTKVVSDPAPLAGGTVTFTVAVGNLGSDFASNVVATDALPPGLTYIVSNVSQGVYDPASGRWSVGRLDRGATTTLVILARAARAGIATNTTTSAADQFDPNSANGSASATVTIRQVTSPAVVSLSRLSFHAQPTTLVLGFNVPLDPSRAQDVFNYRLVRLDALGRPSGPIPIAAAI